jgi:hypothetical protein
VVCGTRTTWGVQNEPWVFVEKHENNWIRGHK